MKRKIETDFGVIEFEHKTSKSRRMTIKIKNDGSVVVLSPQMVSMSAVADFVKSRAKWITFHSAKNKEKFELLQNSELDKIYILGKQFDILWFDETKVDFMLEDGKLLLFGDKEKALNLFKIYLFDFAKSYFAKRFNSIYEELKIADVIKLEVKSVKSIWGSYNTQKHIMKLSFRLISRDPRCIDSVIYHEFAHTKVANHQKEFYSVLLSFCPQYYVWQRGLKADCYGLTDKFILGK